MKILVINETIGDYPADVDRIVEAFADQNYFIAHEAAEWAWSKYSESVAAGWLVLPESSERIVEYLLPYLRQTWFHSEVKLRGEEGY